MPAGQPKTGGSWWRGLTECGPLEKGMASHFSILALRTPWAVWKGKMIGYQKRNSPGNYLPNMLLEISGEINPERMKEWSQSKNNTQLWIWLVIEARSDAVKSNIAWEPGMSGPWIKANWKWSNKRWQGWMPANFKNSAVATGLKKVSFHSNPKERQC